MIPTSAPPAPRPAVSNLKKIGFFAPSGLRWGSLSGLEHFFQLVRAELTWADKTCVRRVFHSEILRQRDPHKLEGYLTERIPLYYRDAERIGDELGDGYFLRPILTTLARLPTATSFQESHFGEILAAEFAQEAMGLRLLYSKLTLLTAENANAYKMDVVLYDLASDPLSLVLLEVKTSVKARGGQPAAHDASIFADLFQSFNKHGDDDTGYDLGAARDRVSALPPDDQAQLMAAFARYGGPPVRYAGICVIDITTHDDEEISVLATRRNEKSFDVDVVCVVDLGDVVAACYGQLEAVRDAACSS